MTSLIALTWKWLGGAWGCSSSNAQAAAAAGLARGCFGYVRKRVGARARVVFSHARNRSDSIYFGGLFLAHKPQNLRIKCWPSNVVGCAPARTKFCAHAWLRVASKKLPTK
jgi:hypothetical protein